MAKKIRKKGGVYLKRTVRRSAATGKFISEEEFNSLMKGETITQQILIPIKTKAGK